MTNEHSLEVLGDLVLSHWYEVRMFPEDMPWIYETSSQAFKKARRTAERTGYPALVYECDQYGEKLVGIAE